MSQVGRKLEPGRSLEPRLRSERVQDGLRKLPGWQPAESGEGVELTLDGPQREAAFDLLTAVVEAAEADSLAPRIHYTGRRLSLHLTSHPAGKRESLPARPYRRGEQR